MAECQKVIQWLANQDLADENAFRQIQDHIQVCQSCEALYQTDMQLDVMVKNGMKPVEPPPGLIARSRQKIESESRPRSIRLPWISWKIAVPVLSMAALVLVMLLNPFAGPLQTLDEIAALSIANHLDTDMAMAFRAGEISDIGQWFTRRLAYAVRLPDLNRLGLSLVGGRECALGKIDAALLFCKSKGKRVSLFVINQQDVGLRFDKDRKYTVEEGDLKVKLWKESDVIYAMVI